MEYFVIFSVILASVFLYLNFITTLTKIRDKERLTKNNVWSSILIIYISFWILLMLFSVV